MFGHDVSIGGAVTEVQEIVMSTEQPNSIVTAQAADDQLGILQRRRIEANIIAPIYRIMCRELGEAKASEIIHEAISEDARKAGARFAADEANGANLRTFIAIQDLWKRDDALITTTVIENDDEYSYDVHRCAYAEMYKEMGAWPTLDRCCLARATRTSSLAMSPALNSRVPRRSWKALALRLPLRAPRRTMSVPIPSVNAERLWRALEEISQFGITPASGLHRLAASVEDGEARDYFVAAAQALGCTVRIDAVGNTFVRRPGTNPVAPAILIGSHLDSQPMAGKYDGTYGVVAGLEVYRALHDARAETEHSIEVVCWTNEEGARFAPAMMGSAYFAGRFAAADLLARQDTDGIDLGSSPGCHWLRRLGCHDVRRARLLLGTPHRARPDPAK